MTHPTIRDVAQKAGVGLGTVSRVLNGSSQVADATRQAVLSAIQELGYRPNGSARLLPRRQRVMNIGVITLPFISYRSFAERLRGIQSELEKAGDYHELVLYSVSSPENYAERLETIVQGRALNGLIIIDLDLTVSQIEHLHNARMPFVGINHFQSRSWTCIGTNNVTGGYLATKYLIGLGHHNIGYVGDSPNKKFAFTTGMERQQGYQNALTEAGITVTTEYIRLGEHDFEEARHLAAQLYTMPNRPTAIFAMSDIQALGCLTAARELGLRVPEDISIIGYDDLEISYHAGLSTVRQHLELSGRMALTHLLQIIGGKSISTATLPPLEVIPRQTTMRASAVRSHLSAVQ